MSLFVGNISRDADKGDIGKAFEKFGAFKIRDKVSFQTLYLFNKTIRVTQFNFEFGRYPLVLSLVFSYNFSLQLRLSINFK